MRKGYAIFSCKVYDGDAQSASLEDGAKRL